MTREEAKEILKHVLTSGETGYNYFMTYEDVEAIKTLAVEPEDGVWQRWSIYPRFNLPTYKCSLCGLIVANIDSPMNYCGNCGARMKGGDEK